LYNSESGKFRSFSEKNIDSKTALEVLSTLSPRPKIIFVLRKPTERIYSVYKFSINNRANLNRNLSFSDFIKMAKKNLDGTKYENDFSHQTIEISKYVNYITKWIKKFGNENIHVFLFENLKADPVNFMKDVSDRIGIDKEFWNQYSFPRMNETCQIRNYTIHDFVVKRLKKFYLGIYPFSPKICDFLRSNYYRLNAKKSSSKSENDRKVLAELDEEFSSCNDALGKTLNIDLSVWK